MRPHAAVWPAQPTLDATSAAAVRCRKPLPCSCFGVAVGGRHAQGCVRSCCWRRTSGAWHLDGAELVEVQGRHYLHRRVQPVLRDGNELPVGAGGVHGRARRAAHGLVGAGEEVSLRAAQGVCQQRFSVRWHVPPMIMCGAGRRGAAWRGSACPLEVGNAGGGSASRAARAGLSPERGPTRRLGGRRMHDIPHLRARQHVLRDQAVTKRVDDVLSVRPERRAGQTHARQRVGLHPAESSSRRSVRATNSTRSARTRRAHGAQVARLRSWWRHAPCTA